MRLPRGSVGALTAALLIAFAMWPATQAVRGPDQVVAQEKPKAKTPLVGASGSRHAGNKPKASSKDGKPLPPPIVLESAPIDHPLSSEVLYRSKNESRITAALKAQVDFDIKPQSFKDALDLIASQAPLTITLRLRRSSSSSIPWITR